MSYGFKHTSGLLYSYDLAFVRRTPVLLYETKHIIKTCTKSHIIVWNYIIIINIIDDVLIFSNHVPIFLTTYFVIKEFLQYIYCLSNVSTIIFDSWVVFVGHDLTSYYNYADQSKFKFINDWPLLPHAIWLLFFIDICSFYGRSCPLIETNIKYSGNYNVPVIEKSSSLSLW